MIQGYTYLGREKEVFTCDAQNEGHSPLGQKFVNNSQNMYTETVLYFWSQFKKYINTPC